MLASVIIEARATRAARLSPSLGRAAHALLLKLVDGAEPALAAELHADRGVKPFTAGVLEPGSGQCAEGEARYLRFTSLDDRLSEVILDRIVPHLPDLIVLDGAEFRIARALVSADQHPWAGQDTYDGLAQRHLLGLEPPGRVRLAFFSPTTFRSRERHLPVPLVDLVFGSLLERWNAFAPVRLEEQRATLGNLLAIGRYRLETAMGEVAGGRQVGFVGWCEYVAVTRDPYALRLAHLLADFAFYAGVGHKTTMGLGRARRVGNGRAVSGGAGSKSPPGG